MTTTAVPMPAAPKPSDFASTAEVRWCPGCGDYSILANIKKTLAKMGADKAKTVFVSGIGCSSRFPYYVSTYGFHSIHGRAATLATGLKLARPELNVWMITGDGDALSIGGNHLIHILRRNLDVKIILFNNRIYGLTKGQYSPTSLQGQKTKSSPMGAPEMPIRPISIAIGAEATFAARALDCDVKHMEYVLERAAKHKGTSFVEIYQNCVIFNDGAYSWAADPKQRPENTVYLEHGKPLVYGAAKDKGIKLKGFSPSVCKLSETPAEQLLVHDEQVEDPSLAFLLSRMRHPEFPEPFGIFRDVAAPTYDDIVHGQVATAVEKRGRGDLQALLRGPETWEVSN